MKRAGSQLVFCAPDNILRQSAVEIGSNGLVTRVFSLTASPWEAASTLFYDGVISSDICSLKALGAANETVLQAYNYCDLSTGTGQPVKDDRKLLLDFGTTDTNTVNKLLTQAAARLTAFSLYEIIAACCFFPAEALGQNAYLEAGLNSRIILWKGSDLVNKRLTHQSCIQSLF